MPSTTTVRLTKAFEQGDTRGLDENTAIGIDESLTVSLSGSTVYVWNGVMDDGTIAVKTPTLSSPEDARVYDLQGRRLSRLPRRGLVIRDGRKVLR